MTTEKQAMANRENSKKSTGAKTEAGKQTVSENATKHGLFSSRLIMPFESAEEYHELLARLIESLNPEGAIEELLVEKVAVAMWRQLRLTRAESASIEMSRSIYRYKVRTQVQEVTSDGFEILSAARLEPETEEDREQRQWCRAVLNDFSDILEGDRLDDIEHIKQSAEIYGQLVREMEEDHADTEQEYLESLSQSLSEWLLELVSWCDKKLKELDQHEIIQQALAIVQAKESAPIGNELLTRYQVGLDNELYKALEALRKQQQWRLQNGAVIKAEAG